MTGVDSFVLQFNRTSSPLRANKSTGVMVGNPATPEETNKWLDHRFKIK